MNRPVSPFGPGGVPIGSAVGGSLGAPQVVETTTTTINNGPPQLQGPPMMTSNIMSSGFMPPPMGSVIASGQMMNSGLRGSFVNQPALVTTTFNSGIAPQMMNSGFRAPPLPPPSQVYPAPTSVMRSGIMQPGLNSNIMVNPRMNSYIGQGATTVTDTVEVDEPGRTTITTTQYNTPGGNMSGMAGVGMGAMGVSGIGMSQGANMNAMAGVAGMTAMGASGVGIGMNQMGMSNYGAVGPVASIGGGALMPGPTGVGLDMVGRLVDMGRIRLEKIEHTPSYNLFSMLDDHAPLASFRVMPHKLRNY